MSKKTVPSAELMDLAKKRLEYVEDLYRMQRVAEGVSSAASSSREQAHAAETIVATAAVDGGHQQAKSSALRVRYFEKSQEIDRRGVRSGHVRDARSGCDDRQKRQEDDLEDTRGRMHTRGPRERRGDRRRARADEGRSRSEPPRAVPAPPRAFGYTFDGVKAGFASAKEAGRKDGYSVDGRLWERKHVSRGLQRVLRCLRHTKDSDRKGKMPMDRTGAVKLEVLCEHANIAKDYFRYGIVPLDQQDGHAEARVDVFHAGADTYARAKWGHSTDQVDKSHTDWDGCRQAELTKASRRVQTTRRASSA